MMCKLMKMTIQKVPMMCKVMKKDTSEGLYDV